MLQRDHGGDRSAIPSSQPDLNLATYALDQIPKPTKRLGAQLWGPVAHTHTGELKIATNLADEMLMHLDGGLADRPNWHPRAGSSDKRSLSVCDLRIPRGHLKRSGDYQSNAPIL